MVPVHAVPGDLGSEPGVEAVVGGGGRVAAGGEPAQLLVAGGGPGAGRGRAAAARCGTSSGPCTPATGSAHS